MNKTLRRTSKSILTNVNIYFDEPKATIFEIIVSRQQNRKIASVQLNGEGARFSAIKDEYNENTIWWQIEDAKGNKIAGTINDLDTAIGIAKAQL